MQSYLRGMALKLFKPDLLGLGNPNSSRVHCEAPDHFSPHDPIADAKHQLNHLCMKDIQWVN